MKDKHAFLFSPGKWVGEGKIILNMVAEELSFTMDWQIQEKDSSGKIECVQEITIDGLSEGMRNELVFYDFSPKIFSVEMENGNIGKVSGTGLIDPKVIAWEFRENDLQFEGFETYKMVKEGEYSLHGEYITTDQLRTLIEGTIRQEI